MLFEDVKQENPMGTLYVISVHFVFFLSVIRIQVLNPCASYTILICIIEGLELKPTIYIFLYKMGYANFPSVKQPYLR